MRTVALAVLRVLTFFHSVRLSFTTRILALVVKQVLDVLPLARSILYLES